jgi:hypothetical protein
VVVVVLSLFFYCSHVIWNPDERKFFQCARYDCLLFAFLFVYVGPTECCSLENFGGPWRVIVVDLQTFEEKTNKTF